jgi:hypothetical protein
MSTSTIISDLHSAIDDLLGDKPDIQSGSCVHCGRDYRDEPQLEGGACPSDDCPGARARSVSARAKGGVL